MKECIQVTKKYENEGLGNKRRKMNDMWWEDSYNNILSKVKENKKEVERMDHYTRSRSNSIASVSVYSNKKGLNNKRKKTEEDDESIESIIIKRKNKDKKERTKTKIIKIIHSDDEE
jgi:hypothetical protein